MPSSGYCGIAAHMASPKNCFDFDGQRSNVRGFLLTMQCYINVSIKIKIKMIGLLVTSLWPVRFLEMVYSLQNVYSWTHN